MFCRAAFLICFSVAKSSPCCLYKNILHHKQYCEDAEGGVEFLEVAAEGVDGYITDDAAEDAVGDAVGQGHHDDGDEGGYRFGVVVEVDVLDGGEHVEADDDQHGGGG